MGDGFGEPRQIVDFCCLPEAELLSNEFRVVFRLRGAQLSPGLRAVFLLRDVEVFLLKIRPRR